MEIYKIKLFFKSPILTPPQADIIFGHLCWVIAYRDGEKALQAFLKPFKENKPPFIISDGFPFDLLPKPLIVESYIEGFEERKELKKINFLTLEDFNQVVKGEKVKLHPSDINLESYLITHNIISRLTNTSLREGGVYSLEEIFIQEITTYVKVVSLEWLSRIEELFKELSKGGFGKKKSIGKGHFSVSRIEPFDGFTEIENPNGFVTLSNFCPGENDPTEGFYKTFVKYGKLGEEFTFSKNPFKKPLLMIKTGSVFKTDNEPKEFYGRIVENISASKPEVIQYAYSFTIPIQYKESK